MEANIAMTNAYLLIIERSAENRYENQNWSWGWEQKNELYSKLKNGNWNCSYEVEGKQKLHLKLEVKKN